MRLRSVLASPLVLLLALPALVACGAERDIAVDGPEPIRPHHPIATGAVRTAGLATVIDTGTPEVCLGPVAESFPPQCGGPELVGWDWTGRRGAFEQEGSVRWGRFALSGTWDGQRLTVTGVVPAALYDAATPTTGPTSGPVSGPTSAPPVTWSPAELGDAQREARRLPGALDASVVDGRVLVEVTYDDGSLQTWTDEHLGRGVVVVRSQLVDRG